MPKYLVEMHDGRKFQVEADSPPSEAEVLAHLGGETPAPAAPKGEPEPDTFAGGFMRSLGDTAAKTGAGILEGLNPIDAVGGLLNTVAHPIEAVKGVVNTVAHPIETVKSLSDPETGGKAIGNLLLGGVTGRVLPHVPDVAPKVGPAVSAAGRGVESFGKMLDRPSRYVGAWEMMTNPTKGAAMLLAPPAVKATGRLIQRAGQAITPADAAPSVAAAAAEGVPVPTGPHMDRSVPVQAGSLTKQQLAERIKFGHGTPPEGVAKPPLGGRLRMGPERPPIRVSPESAMQPPRHEWTPETWREFVEKDLGKNTDIAVQMAEDEARRTLPQHEQVAFSSNVDRVLDAYDKGTPMSEAVRTQFGLQQPSTPMRGPRVQVGAEVVGRQQGLPKEAVRQQTGPILGEAPGEASPVLPKQPLGRIIDTLKAMPPEEREAYVAKATSGKAQWQIETLRRTLEHLGLLVPVAAAVPSVRDLVMQKLGREP